MFKSLTRDPCSVELALGVFALLLSGELPAFADGGRELLRARRWADAVVALRAELQDAARTSGVRSERWAEATQDLARALTFSGRRGEALRLLNLGSGRLQARADALSRVFLSEAAFRDQQEAWALMRAERFGEALNRVGALELKESGNVEVLIRKGQLLFLTGQLESAVETLKSAHLLSPRRPEIKLWLGRVLLSRGEVEEAWTLLSAAADAMPDSDQAFAWRAEALAVRGNRNTALEGLRSRVEEKPAHATTLTQWVEMLISSPAEDLRGDMESLWLARRALKSLAQAGAEGNKAEDVGYEGELGFSFLTGARLTQRVETLLARVDAAIETTSDRSAASP